MVSRQIRRIGVAIYAGALLMSADAGANPARASDAVLVFVDQATVIRLPERVSTIVVGNPLIADVTVQPGSTLVVTGKGYGATNVVALDRSGNVLMEKAIQVKGPREEVVVVYRGVHRETYSCRPKCEPRITLGDGPDYFNAAIGQAGARSAQAQSGTQPAAPPR